MNLFLPLAALAVLIVVLSFTTSTLEKWKAEKALTRALVLWTGFLAIATFLGAIFAGFTLNAIQGQLDEMRKAAADTKKAIESTNRLAAAAEASASEQKILAAAAQRSAQFAESSQRLGSTNKFSVG
jgi:MFS superfamily sulfate permease-like transporter